jgi:prevent-host-death family protein
MKTVNVAELKNRLSTYLQFVREGEEVIIKDRNRPVARISRFDTSGLSETERRLVASGALKLPEEDTPNWDEFWDEYFSRPGARISQKALIRAVIEERKEGW